MSKDLSPKLKKGRDFCIGLIITLSVHAGFWVVPIFDLSGEGGGSEPYIEWFFAYLLAWVVIFVLCLSLSVFLALRRRVYQWFGFGLLSGWVIPILFVATMLSVPGLRGLWKWLGFGILMLSLFVATVFVLVPRRLRK